MRKIRKRRVLAMALSIVLTAGGSGIAAEETDFSEVSLADVFVQGMAETEVLLQEEFGTEITDGTQYACLLYTSPSPRD